ncbi:acyltransferase [Rhodopirellula sallentina]|uniref:acyltransferase n=1 Tax=Rhodopirellula sallentina TaxID=1263869 RepID=UPI001F1AD137|nr:acyltransferase [Rhodopirellula sallentina]
MDNEPERNVVREFGQRLMRRIALLPRPTNAVRSAIMRIRGASIGHGTSIPASTMCTWPHQLAIGKECIIQPDVFFNYDHYWTPGPSIQFGNHVFIGRGCEFNIRCQLNVGDDCLIASGVKMIDHDHGSDLGCLMRQQENNSKPISIKDNVWIGVNATILKGVTIGDGAIVAAASVVNRSIGPNEVWAGVPARMIRKRG